MAYLPEGPATKGGHNPPNTSSNRPPAPQGSGGSKVKVFEHTSSCGYWREQDKGDCTCGLDWRIKLQTEREQYNAWRKRAMEAERELVVTRAELDGIKDHLRALWN